MARDVEYPHEVGVAKPHGSHDSLGQLIYICQHSRNARYLKHTHLETWQTIKTLKILSCHLVSMKKNARSLLALSLSLFIYKPRRIPIRSKSRRALIVSFVLPSISRIVLTNVSNTFFSTCITSRLCLNFSLNQYGGSKNINLCVQFICVKLFQNELNPNC